MFYHSFTQLKNIALWDLQSTTLLWSHGAASPVNLLLIEACFGTRVMTLLEGID